ncbi:MAG: gliding motility-associated C-terminal domain-containing protein [Elusimicrobiota bacterium]
MIYKKDSTIRRFLCLSIATAIFLSGLPLTNTYSYANSGVAYLICRVVGEYDSPYPVTNLTADSMVIGYSTWTVAGTSGRIKLIWTAPEDRPSGDQPHSYLVRYATFSIYDIGGSTQTWWDHSSARTLTSLSLPPNWGIPSEVSPHSTEIKTLTGMSPGAHYWFGIKALDKFYNHSDLDDNSSSVIYQSSAFASTLISWPSPITSITALAADNLPGGIKLRWFSPYNNSDDGGYYTGDIIKGRYRIVYATHTPPFFAGDDRYNPQSKWSNSSSIYISTSTVPLAEQTYLITGLLSNATYFFRIWTADEWYLIDKATNNWSGESYPAFATPFAYYAPNDVKNLTALSKASVDLSTGSYIELNWTNPGNISDLDGIRICYSTTAYPSNKDFPVQLNLTGLPYSTTDAFVGYIHLKLPPRTTYYYNIFAFSKMGLFSGGAMTYCYTSKDIISPEPPAGLSAQTDANTSNGTYITLNWSNPDKGQYRNADWTDIEIYVSTFSSTGQQSTFDASLARSLSTSATFYKWTNLVPQTTYYLWVRNLDGGNNFSSSTVKSFTWKDTVPPGAITEKAYTPSYSEDIDVGCKLDISFRYPADSDLDRSYVTYRDDKYPSNPGDGISEELPKPSAGEKIIRSYSELIGNTTYYFSIFLYDWSGNLTTSTVMGVVPVPQDKTLPFMPLGMKPVKENNTFKLYWSAVEYQHYITDVSSISGITSPVPKSSELYRYQIYESDDWSDWKLLARVKPGQATEISLSIGDTVKYYKVRSVDIGGNYNDSMIADNSDGLNLYSLAADNSYVAISREVQPVLNGATNNLGGDIYIKWTRNTGQEKGPIFKSWTIEPHIINKGVLEKVKGFGFGEPKAEISLMYDVGTISSRGPQMSSAISEPEKWLSIFFHNGREWLKLPSSVDAGRKRLSCNVKFIGDYQIRYALNSTEFTYFKVMPKIITPNNDGTNDKALFIFDNPKTTNIKIKIFDLTGAEVKDLGEYNQHSYVSGEIKSWDGTDSQGNRVPPGTYIYQLEGEEKVFNGTIIVAR